MMVIRRRTVSAYGHLVRARKLLQDREITVNKNKGIVKVVEIAAREWFDRVNGNSYWSAWVSVHVGTDSAPVSYAFTFEYGYGDQARNVVLDTLAELGEIPSARYGDLRESGVLVTYSMRQGCRKRELLHDKDTAGMSKVLPAVFKS